MDYTKNSIDVPHAHPSVKDGMDSKIVCMGISWTSHGIPSVLWTLGWTDRETVPECGDLMDIPWDPICPGDTWTGRTERQYQSVGISWMVPWDPLCPGDTGTGWTRETVPECGDLMDIPWAPLCPGDTGMDRETLPECGISWTSHGISSVQGTLGRTERQYESVGISWTSQGIPSVQHIT